MELTGPGAEQLTSQNGNSDQLKQALAAIMPGISQSRCFTQMPHTTTNAKIMQDDEAQLVSMHY